MGLLDNLDPEVLKDFKAESGELVDGLDRDLVALESKPDDMELINSIFRAMHTIKGSSSFMGLTNLADFTHAAEEAINHMRSGDVSMSTEIMDHLLDAVDVLRRMLDELSQGELPGKGPTELIDALRQIGGKSDKSEKAPVEMVASAGGDARVDDIVMSDSDLDLLPFMVEDLEESIHNAKSLIEKAASGEAPAEIADELVKYTDEMLRTVNFFEIEQLDRELKAVDIFARQMAGLSDEALSQATPRVVALMHIIDVRIGYLKNLKLVRIDDKNLLDRLGILLSGESLPDDAVVVVSADCDAVLANDGVIMPGDGAVVSVELATPVKPTAGAEGSSGSNSSSDNGEGKGPRKQGEQNIRVNISRLESLLNLVGELVLQKNRIINLSRRLSEGERGQNISEELSTVSSDLEHVTDDLQNDVMKIRMQPMNRLFSRYPRVIRDLARATGKQINLEIVGADTEVDRSVLELLGDPLVHILRNSADHGLETPDVRQDAGKNPMGVIRLSAQHEGNNVFIEIVDDGKGIDTVKLGRIAVDKGVVTEEELADMQEHTILQLIFKPGFSTMKKVSNLSGRGVGMDVVRTNITSLGGIIDLSSKVGQGTRITIRIPLTVAIMRAMMVRIATQLYAIPLVNVHRIVRLSEATVRTINGNPVILMYESILPLIDMRQRFMVDVNKDDETSVVIVSWADRLAGLIVDEMLGQQEVVIKPLDEMFNTTVEISGATVREDGGVSLILDVAGVMGTLDFDAAQAA